MCIRDSINTNDVTVMVDLLPINSEDKDIGGNYEFAHSDEPDIINDIGSVVVHTYLESHIWPRILSHWTQAGINILHNPVAANMMKALPMQCNILTDVAMVSNFGEHPDAMQKFIIPLFRQIDLLGYQYQIFGDEGWARAGIRNNGYLPDYINRLATVYATALVCPNVHHIQQVQLGACVNIDTFMIPLCGGIQVVDNPLAKKYLGDHVDIATNTAEYVSKVLTAIKNHDVRNEKIRASAEYVATNHTYFNRLVSLFHAAGLLGLADETETQGKRKAVQHCWEIDSRFSAAERGVEYEQNVI